MQPNADTPPFRLFHILLLLSVFACALLPLGEVLGPWLLMRIARPKSPERKLAGRRLVAFQASWAIHRLIVTLVIAMFWLGAIMPESPRPSATYQAPPGEEFTIPGEPTPGQPLEEPYPDPLKEARDTRRLFEDLKTNPEIFVIQSFWNQPRVMLITMLGLLVLFVLWFVAMTITALNVLVVARDGRPWYPLTLPWILRLGKKEEAGNPPAPITDSV